VRVFFLPDGDVFTEILSPRPSPLATIAAALRSDSGNAAAPQARERCDVRLPDRNFFSQYRLRLVPMPHIKKVLAIGAHPDDIELGCGGSLAKLADQGVKVHALLLSGGRNGTTADFDRLQETRTALRTLGVRDLHTFDFPDTLLHTQLPLIITVIERACAQLQPDRVYTMFEKDRHQDHRTTFEASIIACRNVRQVLCYETPSSWPNFSPRIYEDIDDQLERKLQALSCHDSQKHREYMQKDQVRCSAYFRGQQIGIGASEGFIPYRMVL
jgi:LmbE family N-acetylglucosaminyl deacetylase